MNRIEVILFMGWSALLVGLFDPKGWELLSCQAVWITLTFISRAIIRRSLRAWGS